MAAGRGRERSPWSELGPFAHLGATVVMCVVIGLAAGYWADRWLGTAPWLLLVGLGFGIAAAVVNFVRAFKRLDRMTRRDDGDA